MRGLAFPTMRSVILAPHSSEERAEAQRGPGPVRGLTAICDPVTLGRAYLPNIWYTSCCMEELEMVEAEEDDSMKKMGSRVSSRSPGEYAWNTYPMLVSSPL